MLQIFRACPHPAWKSSLTRRGRRICPQPINVIPLLAGQVLRLVQVRKHGFADEDRLQVLCVHTASGELSLGLFCFRCVHTNDSLKKTSQAKWDRKLRDEMIQSRSPRESHTHTLATHSSSFATDEFRTMSLNCSKTAQIPQYRCSLPTENYLLARTTFLPESVAQTRAMLFPVRCRRTPRLTRRPAPPQPNPLSSPSHTHHSSRASWPDKPRCRT